MRIGGGKRGLASVALLCHLLTTFGFAVPVRRKTGDVPFPCQSHPCGCLTAEECWKGDCCCFTLEEKAAWAAARGIDPPSHVRERLATAARPATKPKSCCSPPRKRPAACCEIADTDCPLCAEATGPAEAFDERELAPAEPARVAWVAGVFAKKCRGEGPGALNQHDPCVVADAVAVVPSESARSAHPYPTSDRAAPARHRPPTPPPRTL